MCVDREIKTSLKEKRKNDNDRENFLSWKSISIIYEYYIRLEGSLLFIYFFLSFSRLTEERIDDYSYHFKHFLNLFEEISTRAKSQDVIVAV